MQISADEALVYFRRLPASMQVPSLHPSYILADEQRGAGLTPRFFIYQEGEHFFYHPFLIEAIPDSDLFDIQSPYGYGGPVATSNDLNFLDAAWAAYANLCREDNVLVEFIRFHPLLENWRFFAGEVLDDRQTVWIDLASPDLMSRYATRVRTAIRKAVKNGLKVEWWDSSSFLTVFPELYEQTMRSLGANDFYLFTDAYYRHLSNSEFAWLAVCRHDKDVVGAAIFLRGLEMLEYHLSASNQAGKALGATNLLLHEAASLAQREQMRQLHLGGGTTADPENPLLFYKAGFSRYRSTFKIGKKVHQPNAYAALKEEWENRIGRRANRILFYR